MRLRGVVLIVAVSVILEGSVAIAVAQGTPEQALVDVLTTEKAEVVERHLPVTTVDAILHLRPADRQAAERAILIGENLRVAGLEPRVVDDGSSLLEFWRKDDPHASAPELEIGLVRELMGGVDALLELTVDDTHHGGRKILVWMELEDGEWRFTQIENAYEAADLAGPAFVEPFKGSREREIDAPALQVLRSMNNALITYQSSYPELGFPSDLAALAPPEEDGADPSPDRADLLGSDLAARPYVTEGYLFNYQLLAAGADGSYSIIARPVSRKPGASSFFTDESGVIRRTTEDRDPTADDDPVE